jgi:hypothetical protein
MGGFSDEIQGADAFFLSLTTSRGGSVGGLPLQEHLFQDARVVGHAMEITYSGVQIGIVRTAEESGLG